MRCGYVVLYVTDAAASLRFWVEQMGMVEKGRKEAGPYSIAQVGFADQDFSLELVPLDLMKENPSGLDLTTPSMAFRVPDLETARAELVARGVTTTELADHGGVSSFAFSDNEERWFAVLQS